MKGLKNTSTSGSDDRTSQDLNIKFVLAGVIVVVLAIWLLPPIQAGLISALLIVVFGFFFATVSSKMVGLVGSSNNPVSGMAIATLLISTILLKVTGDTGAHGMVSAITIGSIICIIAAIAGDTSQDLKTGFLLGATPKKQQIDGKRTVKEVADNMHEKYGDKVEPLYPRISMYIKTLLNYEFIELIGS